MDIAGLKWLVASVVTIYSLWEAAQHNGYPRSVNFGRTARNWAVVWAMLIWFAW